MARSRDLEVHLPQEVWKEMNRTHDKEERREIEGRRYSMTRTWQERLVLEYALREFARQQGYEITEDTEVVPLRSGEIEVRQPDGESKSFNPLR
jgi:2-polyprenyl-6-methoxyphenol hydroxylase-like FAD-dependent oxidoreductase